MVNQKDANEAVKMHKDMPNLMLGLHVNLTNEYPASDAQNLDLLVGKDKKFKKYRLFAVFLFCNLFYQLYHFFSLKSTYYRVFQKKYHKPNIEKYSINLYTKKGDIMILKVEYCAAQIIENNFVRKENFYFDYRWYFRL